MNDIPALRSAIDELDDQLINLIRHRARLSAAIQEQRVREGGHRKSLPREGQILDRYHAALEAPGVAVARALLVLCRGH